MMRLDKYLAHAKVGTRREVKKMIRKGIIYVNDVLCRDDDYKIDETKDVVVMDGEVIQYQEYYYIMLHKPDGYVSASIDDFYPTVLDLVYEDFALDLFCVGRLDVDTEGLLMLTNDGPLAHALLSPKHHVEKEYYVELKEDITQEHIDALEAGIQISEDEVCKPCKVLKKDSRVIHLILTQGKFHQVKRMMHAVDNEVVYLKRIRMNDLWLDEALALGEYKQLSDDELKLLRGE